MSGVDMPAALRSAISWNVHAPSRESFSQAGVTIRAERHVEAEYLWTLVLDDDGDVAALLELPRVATVRLLRSFFRERPPCSSLGFPDPIGDAKAEAPVAAGGKLSGVSLLVVLLAELPGDEEEFGEEVFLTIP